MKTILQTHLAPLAAGVMVLLTPAASGAVSTNWTSPNLIPAGVGTNFTSGTVGNSMAVTTNGQVWLFHRERISATNEVRFTHLRYSSNPTGSDPADWPSLEFPPITAFPSAIAAGGAASMAIAPDGFIHCAWFAPSLNQIAYARLDPGDNSWSNYHIAYNGTNNGIEHYEIEVDRGGTVHLLWHEGDHEVSGSSADVRYARMAVGETNFTIYANSLNAPDSVNSAYPVVDWSGAAGDLLVVAWREESVSNNWDVIMNVSTNNGVTWRDTPIPVKQTAVNDWDPLVSIDRHNLVHLIYPAVNGLIAEMRYLRYDDPSVWNDPARTPSPVETLLSPTGEHHQLPYTIYDHQRDIMYFFWKRITLDNGRHEDLLGRYALNRGQWLSEIEELTDTVATATSTAFPDYVVAPDGSIFANYTESTLSTNAPPGFGTLHFIQRPGPPPALEPELTFSNINGTSVQFTIPSEFAVSYEAEVTTNLDAPWSPHLTAQTGTGELLIFELQNNSADFQFLRLKATR